VLALLGSRAPTSLTLFLTTVAILIAMFVLNRLGMRSLWPSLIGAALLWYAVLLSGVHATVAGVLAALAIPIARTPGTPDAQESPLHRLEHASCLGPRS
jgi:NhaA family Na+:H+ antiporter